MNIYSPELEAIANSDVVSIGSHTLARAAGIERPRLINNFHQALDDDEFTNMIDATPWFEMIKTLAGFFAALSDDELEEILKEMYS